MNNNSDIVEQLRNHIAITTRIHYAKDGYPEPVQVHGPSPICLEAADEIERLRKERDEARREVCWIMQKTGFMRGDYAYSRGWDCFKDPEGPFPDSVNTFWDVIENDTQMWINKVDQQRKVLDWVLPQLFQEVYPEYNLGHPRMYVMSTAIKKPDGGIPKDMWDTVLGFLKTKS